MYTIKSVQCAPDLQQNDDLQWYRYVIANETTTITGMRSGPIHEVMQHVESCVITLNQRNPSGKVKIYKPVNTDTIF